MKNLSLFIAFLFAVQSLSAQKTVEAGTVPTTIEEFLSLRDKVSDTPEGGAAVFAMAILMYTQDEELGEQALTIAIDKSRLSTGDVYKGYQPPTSINYHLKNLQGKKYVARSYVLGTSPQNGYALPKVIKYKVSRNKYSQQSNGDVKVFVQSSGADTPRPVTMRKNNRGVWKAYNYNSLFVGTRPPASTDDDRL